MNSILIISYNQESDAANMTKAEQAALSFNTALQKPVGDMTKAVFIFVHTLCCRQIVP